MVEWWGATQPTLSIWKVAQFGVWHDNGDKHATTLDGFLQIFHNFIQFNIHILLDRNRMTLMHSHIVTGFRQEYQLIPNDFQRIALGRLAQIRHAASPRTSETIGAIIRYQ